MKASRVQQLEPTRAMRVENLGMASTISPVSTTSVVLSTHWRDGGREGEEGREGKEIKHYTHTVPSYSQSHVIKLRKSTKLGASLKESRRNTWSSSGSLAMCSSSGR